MLNHYVASLRLFAKLCAGGNNHAVRFGRSLGRSRSVAP